MQPVNHPGISRWSDAVEMRLTLMRRASATSSSVLRLSSRGPLLIAPSLASSSVTAGIQSSLTSVSMMISMSFGDIVMELRRGWS